MLIAATSAAAVAAAVYWLSGSTDVTGFYAASLRGALFSGFLGLGGFLLSLKTFIVVKMKEGLYDHKIYRARYADAKKANPKIAGTLFAPLGQLRSLLFAAIVSSLLTAILQVSLGLVARSWAVAACLAAGGFSVALLAQSLFQINRNLKTWFEYLDLDAAEAETTVKDDARAAT